MTKEEQDRIKEELNRAFAKNEAENEKKKKKAGSASEKKEKTEKAKAAEPAREKKEKTEKAKAVKSAPEKKKKAEKAQTAKAAPARSLRNEKTEAEKPAAAVKESNTASAISDTPAAVPESIRVGRASRSKENGRKHEKTEAEKKEKKTKKAAAKPAPEKKDKKTPKKEAKKAPKKEAKKEPKREAKKVPEKEPKKAAMPAPAVIEDAAASGTDAYAGTRAGRAGARSKDAGEKHGAEPEKRGCLKWILISVVLMIAVGAAAFAFFRYRSGMQLYTAAYIAGTSKDVPAYTIEKDEKAENESGDAGKVSEAERLVRGTQVKRYADKVEIDGVKYVRVDKTLPGTSLTEGTESTEDKEDGRDALYVNEDNLVSSPDDIVQEKEVYVRTPVTIYSEETGPAIESFAPKGSRLEVTGFDKIRPDGYINKYQVKYTNDDGDSVKGYVYGKYMVDSQEKADAVYNENGIADKVADDNYGYDLYGGRASNLDYYPFERPEIKGNEFCAYARAMYVNCEAAVNYGPWVDIINETDCNAVVIDIKDGVLAYESDVAKELSPASYETAYVTKDEYRKGIEAYKKTGAYLIGRIVVFNDPIYAKDHPENCIEYGGSTTWPSAYSRDVWEYNVRLAQEAVREFGFDEIQFDYVRFPENAFEMSKAGNTDFRNVYGEEKGQAIQNFCMYAADQIHDTGAWFSVDVFGESAYGYMTAYGQYWAGISNVVDAISAMPYTDHMGVDGGWEDPYGIMNNWGKRAEKQQEILEDPAAARTWITGYDTPHWSPSFVYGTAELKAQIAGLEDAGLDGGFIPWNAVSSLDKYTQYKDVWNEEQ